MTLPTNQPSPPVPSAGGQPQETTPAAPAEPWHDRLRRLGVVLAAMALGLWVMAQFGPSGGDGFDYALMVALPVALIAPLRRRVVAWLDRIRQPSPRARTIIALSIWVAASSLALGQALRVGRELSPHWHDEHSYHLGAVQLAHGRLWYEVPEDWPGDFFESFHIWTDGFYGSVYWPGAAIMNAPGVWLGLPTVGMPLVIYGATVAMIYLLTARLIDNVAGIMAAMLGSYVLDYYAFSTRLMAQVPTALLGVLLIWTWLRWREAAPGRRLGWVALMGLLAGWLGITRPVDGLAFAIPVAAIVLGTIVGQFARSRGRDAGVVRGLVRPLGLTIAVGVACTLPFLALQAVFNYGTTGHLLEPPFARYIEKYHPGFNFADDAVIAEDALPAPDSALPQKHRYYEQFIASGAVATRTSAWSELIRWRLPTLLTFTLPGRNFIPFAFVGCAVALGLYGAMPARERRFRAPLLVLAAVIACFMVLYTFYSLFLTHYMMTLAVATIPLMVAGLRAIEEAAGGRLRPMLVALLSVAVAAWFGIAAWRFPTQNRPIMTEVRFKHEIAPDLIDGPALVLVRYLHGVNFHNEPVYNSYVPWPDEARIVWAHDLHERNDEILRYYSLRQPQRTVYLMIRPEKALYRLGPVKDVLARFEAGQWPLPPPEVMEAELEAGTGREPWLKNLPPPLRSPEAPPDPFEP